MKKTNIAIIGFGGMGGSHYHSLKTLDYYNIAGIYDICDEACARAESLSLKVYGSPQEVADDLQVDAVLIATPNDLHLPYTEFFAKHKKHIFCEKPISLSYRQTLAMYDAAERSGVVLIVNQNRRQDSDYLTALAVIDNADIGECYQIESRVMGSNGIPGGWRKLQEHGGGMMLDWGVHLIDQINMFMGNKLPKSLYCTMSKNTGFDVDDGFKLQLFYDKLSVEITVDTNCFSPLARWMIYGKKGTAVIANWEVEGGIVLPGEAQEIVGMNAGNGFTKTMAYRTGNAAQVCDLPAVKPDSHFIYRNLHECINGGAAPIIKREEVQNVFIIMEKAFESAKNNSTVVF